MMPESAEIYLMWAQSLDEPLERPFPLPYVCYFLGYLLILLIDRVISGKLHSHITHDKTSVIHAPNADDKIVTAKSSTSTQNAEIAKIADSDPDTERAMSKNEEVSPAHIQEFQAKKTTVESPDKKTDARVV